MIETYGFKQHNVACIWYIYCSQIRCHSCQVIRQSIESFNDISLHISNPQQQLLEERTGLTLESCIATALQSDDIDGVDCPSCTAQVTIQKLNPSKHCSALGENKQNLLLLAQRTLVLGQNDSLSCFLDIDKEDAMRLLLTEIEDPETNKGDYNDVDNYNCANPLSAMDMVKLNQGSKTASVSTEGTILIKSEAHSGHGLKHNSEDRSRTLRRYCAEAVMPAESPLVSHVRTKITKSYALARLPQVLCFHINRNTYDLNGRLKKLDQLVLFDEKLDMAKFVKPAGVKSLYHIGISADQILQKAQCDTVYELCAVIEHKGSANQGHYVTYSRVKDDRSGKFNWMYFSDEQVSSVNWKQVKMCQAYMLLYVKTLTK